MGHPVGAMPKVDAAAKNSGNSNELGHCSKYSADESFFKWIGQAGSPKICNYEAPPD